MTFLNSKTNKNNMEQREILKWFDMVNNTVFPTTLKTGNGTVEGQGLTKRELFAAVAMRELLKKNVLGFDNELEIIAKTSVQFADALIIELNKDTSK